MSLIGLTCRTRLEESRRPQKAADIVRTEFYCHAVHSFRSITSPQAPG